MFGDRPLNHARLVQHERDGFRLIQPSLSIIWQLLERRARAVEHRFPAFGRAPIFQLCRISARLFVIVKSIGNAVGVKPVAGLFHCVAIGYSVKCDGHVLPFQIVRQAIAVS